MGMLSTLLGAYTGQQKGQHDAYVDALASEKDQRDFVERQRQFDEQQALRAQEDAAAQARFDEQQKIATAAEARAAAEAARTDRAWRPPSGTDKYGGYLYQSAAMQPRALAQQLRKGELDLTGAALGNESTKLANAGKAYANFVAPILTQLDIASKKVDIHNAQLNDPNAVQVRQQQMLQYKTQLDQQSYVWQKNYDMSLAQRYGTVDPTKVAKDYQAALKGVDAGQKTLNAMQADHKTPVVPVQARNAIQAAEQSIASAQDPMARANEIISDAGPAGQIVRSSGFTGHVYQVALAEYLRRKMTGAAAPPQQQTPTPAGLNLNVPGINGPATPFSHYGSGGSNAAPPFPGS